MGLIKTVTAVLHSTPSRWTNFAELPDDLLRRQPETGEWSALECLLHMVDVEDGVFASRVRAILAGENFPGYFPDEEGSKMTNETDPAALAAKFAKLRAESLVLVGTIKEDDLSRTAVHGELGEVTLENLLNEWAGHDLMHLVQAEQAMMQPFIEGCGAWYPYFEKHAVK